MIRLAMSTACSESVVAYTRECGGRVRLTEEQLAADRDDLLAEARIGCCQKCGCLSAVAWIEGEYVVARCRTGASVLALGERVGVEPDAGRKL